MIVSRTPLRISFLGGGTDIPDFFRNKEGMVIGTSIDRYVYVNALPLHELAEEKIRFTYRVTESVNDIKDIKHPSMRLALSELKFDGKLNVGTMSDLPGGTGLGSSSSFLVGTLKLLADLQQLDLDNDLIARLAIRIERDLLAENGGWQDQLHATYGGFRPYFFSRSKFEVGQSLKGIGEDTFSGYFSLIPMKGTRNSSEFSPASQGANLKKNKQLQGIYRIASDFFESSFSLRNGTESFISELAIAMNESWKLKKELNNSSITENTLKLISELKNLGVLAIKEVGAGGGGFLLVIHKRGTFSDSSIGEQFPGMLTVNTVPNGVQLFKV